MDNKQIEEGNKLILLFMGGIVGSSTKYPTGEIIIHSIHLGEKQINDFVNETKYHKSWDWLMPVVKKFDYLVENRVINNSKDYEFWCDKIEDAVTRTYEIMPVFKIMVEAIEWYNIIKAQLSEPKV